MMSKSIFVKRFEERLNQGLFIFLLKLPRYFIFSLYNNIKMFILLLRYGTYQPGHYRILRRKRLVYVENPKVACTSIKESMFRVEKYDSKFVLNSTEQRFFIFTFVRNPFFRLVSCYKYLIEDINGRIHLNSSYFFYKLLYGLDEEMTFKDFALKVASISDKYSNTHFKSQTATLHKKVGHVEFNFIGKIENFRHDFKFLSEQFALPQPERKNVTKKEGEDYRDYYDQSLVDIVYERYRRDFDNWYPNAYAELVDYLSEKSK